MEFKRDETDNVILDPKQLGELIDHLTGTCINLDTALEELFELDFNDISEDTLHELDALIFNCATCGWWCDIADMGDEDILEYSCNDCVESIVENVEE